MGIGMFLKVMEIDNAIFQDLESFGKEVFQLWKSCGILFGNILQYPKLDIALHHSKHRICYVRSFCYL